MDPINNSLFKKLLKNINIDNFLNMLKNSIIKLSPIKDSFYKRNIKYSLDNYIYGIIDILKNFSSWNSYTGKNKGDTLRKKHNEWVKLGVYDHFYQESLKESLKNLNINLLILCS